MANGERYPKWIGKYDNLSFEEILEKAKNPQSEEEYTELVIASLRSIGKRLDTIFDNFEQRLGERLGKKLEKIVIEIVEETKIKEEDVHKDRDNVWRNDESGRIYYPTWFFWKPNNKGGLMSFISKLFGKREVKKELTPQERIFLDSLNDPLDLLFETQSEKEQHIADSLSPEILKKSNK